SGYVRSFDMRASRLLVLLVASLGCSTPNFSPSSLVDSVRILATTADKPYVAPGDTVKMQVLAFDGRPIKSEPMGIWWLPEPCFDPAGDKYYACYAAFARTYSPFTDIT